MPLSFEARLAREQGWSLDYTRRVIEEYRRFLYLAATARGGGVTPSKAVDEVWHLHLTYTKSYWDDLCQGVLGKPLHHNPSDGSAGDEKHYGSQYGNTLTRYRSVFGRAAPADIWPSCGTTGTHLDTTARATPAHDLAELERAGERQSVRRLAVGCVSIASWLIAALMLAGGLVHLGITDPKLIVFLVITVLIVLKAATRSRRGSGSSSGSGCGSACGSGASCGGGGCGGGGD